MNALRAQTQGVLDEFNLNFQKSRNEMISRFLSDQQSLNKKFSEYQLHSDNEANVSCDEGTAAKGITIDDIQNRGCKIKDSDNISVTSLITELSFSDDCEEKSSKQKSATSALTSLLSNKPKPLEMLSKKHGQKTSSRGKPYKTGAFNSKTESKNVTSGATNTRSSFSNNESNEKSLTINAPAKSKEDVCEKLCLSTPRFGSATRQHNKEVTKSSSGRGNANKQANHISSQPNQPPNSPELNRKSDGLKPPLHNIQTGRKEKQEKPKKLLTKRIIRPKTAMGLQPTGKGFIALISESEVTENFAHTSTWDDSDSLQKKLNKRSAPLPVRHRFISWDPNEQTQDSHLPPYNHCLRDKPKVPALPSTLNSSRETSYGAPVENNMQIVTKRTPRNKVNKPFIKSHSDYFASIEVEGSTHNKSKNNSDVSNKDRNSNVGVFKQESGTLKRYKGHGNLSGGSRGTQLAVLKLPPVTKQQIQDLPSRSSTSMGYVVKMRPVHIGEEF